MTKITKRQLELLHAIEDLTSKNGTPPTIVELKRELGVSSDQSIYQLLEKLKGAGLIKTEHGKRRSIRLINKQPGAVPTEHLDNYTPLNSIITFSMDVIQKKIFDKFYEIDPQLAKIYKGALFTMAQKKYHPDWIAQVANSFRGIFNVLTRKEKIEGSEDPAIQKISKAFDPHGIVVKTEKTAWEQWNKLNAYFSGVSHYNQGYETVEKEFNEKIEELNELLVKYILPYQFDVYETLDNIIKNGPGKISPEEVEKYLSRNTATYTYFFNTIEHNWFNFLEKNKLLKPTHQVGYYLTKVAKSIPSQIVELARTYKTDYNLKEQESFIWRYFALATLTMPLDQVDQIITIMIKQKWIQNTSHLHDFLFYEIKKLINRLIDEKQYKSLKVLAPVILDIRLTSEKGQSLREIEAYVDSYFYSEIAKSLLRVPLSEKKELVKIFVNKLVKAYKLTDKDKNKLFYIWRPSIEENSRDRQDVANIIIDSIKNLSIECLKELKGKKNVENFIESLLGEFDIDILVRIKLYLYTKYPIECRDKIQWAIVEYFDVEGIEREYDDLVKKEFGNIKKTFQKKYLDKVQKGPAKVKKGDDYINYWKIRKLILVKKSLSKEWQDTYRSLLGTNKEEIFEPRYSGEFKSWIGPTAPKKLDEIKTMSVDQLVNYLIEWKPKDGFAEPSRMGLAREIGEAIKNNPKVYSEEAAKLNNNAIHPVYLDQYFMGLRESFKTNQGLVWEPVIELMTEIVKKAKENMLPEFEKKEEDWGTNWDQVFQHMADLLENGLGSVQTEPHFSLREKIWSIIEYICNNKEPDLEYEKKYGGENMDYYSLSINTARGEAFHALFQYIFWCDRNIKQKPGNRIPEEVKKILEDHLDIKKEPGLTLRSVYGRFFPWLYFYDKNWVKTITDKLFPLDNLERRYAAWETYMNNAIYPEVFEYLRPKYEEAIQELKKTSIKRKRYDNDPHEKLINHLMIAYSYSVIEYNDPLLESFYKEANKEQKGVGVSFIGRVYIASEDATRKDNPDKEKIKLFWELRLKDSNAVEELKEFGWWIKEGYFDDEWMLKMLLETLNKTSGIIEHSYRVSEVLKKLAQKYPLLVSQCLLKIVKAKHQDQFLRITREDDIESIVKQIYHHKDEVVRKNILQVSDQMLRLGNDNFRIYTKLKDEKPPNLPDNK